MKRYMVETRATVRRFYFVDAASEKDAIAKSCNIGATSEEDQDEETLSVTELVGQSATAQAS